MVKKILRAFLIMSLTPCTFAQSFEKVEVFFINWNSNTRVPLTAQNVKDNEDAIFIMKDEIYKQL